MRKRDNMTMIKKYLKDYEAVQLNPELEQLSNTIQDLIRTDDLCLTIDAYDSIMEEAKHLLSRN